MKRLFFTLAFIPLLAQAQVYFPATPSAPAGEPPSFTLKDSLVGYWCLNEPNDATSYRDTSGNGHHLTVTSATSNAGVISTSNRMDGVGEAGSIASNAKLQVGTTGLTIAAWIYPLFADSATWIATYRGFVSKDQSGNREYALIFDITDKAFWFRIGDGTNLSGVTAVSSISIPLASWHYVIGWYNPITNRNYIQVNNGAIDSATCSITPTAANANFWLGGFFSGNYAASYVDEVAVWKRALSSTERSDLYNSGAGKAYGTW